MLTTYESFVSEFLRDWPSEAVIEESRVQGIDEYLPTAFDEVRIAVFSRNRNSADIIRGIAECSVVLIRQAMSVLSGHVRDQYGQWLFERLETTMRSAGVPLQYPEGLSPAAGKAYLSEKFLQVINGSEAVNLRDSVAAFLVIYSR